jgi:hypothetical protein
MGKGLQFIATEVRKALPPTLFFMVVFQIATLIRHLDEESYGVTPGRSASATIAALVFGKVYLLLGERCFMNVFAGRPLIFSTLWKTGLYSLVGSFLMVCEEIIPLIHQHAALAPAWQQYLSETVWPRFWANHLFMLLSVLTYTAASELIGAVGKTRVRTLFLGISAPARSTRR